MKQATSDKEPDPDPLIIDLLSRIANLLITALPRDHGPRNDLLKEIHAIVDGVWYAREDIAELRDVLGLAPRPGRRRTHRAAQRQMAMAIAHAEHTARGTPDPVSYVGAEFGASQKTVRRAIENFGETATHVVTATRLATGGRNIDYSDLRHEGRTRTPQFLVPEKCATEPPNQ